MILKPLFFHRFPSAEVVQWQSDTTDQGGLLDDVNNVKFYIVIAPVMNGPYFPEGSAELVQNFQASFYYAVFLPFSHFNQ